MPSLINFLAYQLVWFIAVLGAGAGYAFPALAATTGFMLVHLSRSRRRSADVRLAAAALVLGAALDGLLARSQWLGYAATSVTLPPGGAPMWILCLWVAFALTLNHSLRWVMERPLAAITLGFVGGPLAYLAAARLAAAVRFPTPPWRALATLGVGWAAAMGILCALQRSRASERDSCVRVAASPE